ncbi:glycosyltransferase family 4 protein [Priestia megaterium]|uniref:glycosyltransferase family 4 protein n=1 Tax=Priestia megaterium TaxID=1404 RepID=UPI001F140757|nr:glycosyltransferase family 4 protein [Priestia megaterium]UMZ34198.1 glycosyltransferase family 4 protein [Priestia megaterium]
MKKVLILANHFITLYAFRKELVNELLESGNEVYLSLPDSPENTYFQDKGCKIINTPLDRRGTNPLSDFKLLIQYVKIIKELKPDIILTYTIKPNTYGGIAAGFLNTKAIHTVTGLGSVYIQNMWQRKIAVFMNKIAFKSASKVFFLNEHNREFYGDLGIIKKGQATKIVPGSGVNLNKFKYKELSVSKGTTFTFVARILKDKGIEEYLEAAKNLKSLNPQLKFQVVGFVDEEKYIDLLKQYQDEGIIEYLGKRNDIPSVMEKSSCIVLPSYGEGRGTVLQEGAAIGRPLITCDTYGCKDNVEEGVNGYLCKVANAKSLEEAMRKFLELSMEEKINMGRKSRKKAEKEFDRKLVIETYIKEVNKLIRDEDSGYENVSRAIK